MTKICIIPARGGSKRIPRKNIKLFLGKPIIAYSIEAAISSGLFDKVVVSTDDKEIAEISKKYGAEIPFYRSEKNSDDFATTFDVIKEVIDTYKNIKLEFDLVCCLYPCAPFVNDNILHQAYQMLMTNDVDTVFPVIPFGFPIQRALRVINTKVAFVNSQNALKRSQDLETTYHDAGQFYFAKTKSLLNSGKLINSNSSCIFISQLNAQDIDNEEDWKLAELKYKLALEK